MACAGRSGSRICCCRLRCDFHGRPGYESLAYTPAPLLRRALQAARAVDAAAIARRIVEPSKIAAAVHQARVQAVKEGSLSRASVTVPYALGSAKHAKTRQGLRDRKERMTGACLALHRNAYNSQVTSAVSSREEANGKLYSRPLRTK